MSTKTKPTRSAKRIDPTIAETAPAAFASILAEIRAVPASAIIRNNLDMPRAARRGLAVSERLVPLLTELAELPKLDFRAVTSLRTRALAVLHANELVQEGSAATTAHLSTLLAEASPLRELMLSVAESLALAGFVAPERVAAIRRGKGHVDTAGDLQALGRLYGELWKLVHDKVPVTWEMVERSITLSADLMEALGIREIGEIGEDPLMEPNGPVFVRGQAFALFTQAYDECRRGVEYLRWHEEDAGVLVPSLHTPRGKSRGGTAEVDEDEDDGSGEAASESAASVASEAIGNARLEA